MSSAAPSSRTTNRRSLVQRFARRGLKRMPDVNRRQALVIQGGVVLDNPNGTAPGQMVEVGNQLVILLPGPPRELLADDGALVAGPSRACRLGAAVRTTLFTAGAASRTSKSWCSRSTRNG